MLWLQRISTGRGGTGNIRSPSRDPVRGDNASAGVSPARSDDRGRTSDRETTISFDVAHEADVVSGISPPYSRGTLVDCNRLGSIRLAVVARAT
jgi:hypothetical protein